MEAGGSTTRVTLLGRLQRDPTDAAAWAEFVDHYGPRVYRWCRKWHLQEADARDVTQTVLLKLALKMREFRYDPSRSFRAWLKTVARNAWQDFLDARQRAAVEPGDPSALLENVEAREDLLRQIEEEFDRELLEEAMARVRLRVAARTWDAFRLLALEGLSGADAAARLGMKVAHVFVARSNVQKLLREEVQRLEANP
jgi:RNA polymerase sigma-70 factor (ECF subfamily)